MPLRPTLVGCAAVWLTAVFSWGIGGCASSSAESRGPDRVVADAPSESSEKPVWAEGPVDDQESDAKTEETEKARGPELPPTRPPESLESVFPDETITLDFRQARVRRVMQVFQLKSEVQLVLDSEVGGRVTVRTDDAPIVDAFRAVLKAAHLGYQIQGRAIVVRPE